MPIPFISLFRKIDKLFREYRKRKRLRREQKDYIINSYSNTEDRNIDFAKCFNRNLNILLRLKMFEGQTEVIFISELTMLNLKLYKSKCCTSCPPGFRRKIVRWLQMTEEEKRRQLMIKFGITEIKNTSNFDTKCKACGKPLGAHDGSRCPVEIYALRNKRIRHYQI